MRENHFPVHSPDQLQASIERGAFANPLLKKILHQFGKPAFARSSACMEFESFLRRIGAGGKTALEIGTYHGITAIILSQYFDQVVCVSVDNDPGTLMKHKLVEYLGIKNIVFHDCESNVEKAAIVNGLEFDFAYSDGDHTHDTYTDFALVKRCGRVLQHEAWPIQAPVWNLMHSLPAAEVTWADHDCFAYWERGRG